MARSRRAFTDEERRQQRAQQRELVIASIEQLRTSEGRQAYLHARARFPSYSWRNVLLILSQHPTAERVAGFRGWLELGYCVTRGAPGFASGRVALPPRNGCERGATPAAIRTTGRGPPTGSSRCSRKTRSPSCRHLDAGAVDRADRGDPRR
jgi:hypothetical protein